MSTTGDKILNKSLSKVRHFLQSNIFSWNLYLKFVTYNLSALVILFQHNTNIGAWHSWTWFQQTSARRKRNQCQYEVWGNKMICMKLIMKLIFINSNSSLIHVFWIFPSKVEQNLPLPADTLKRIQKNMLVAQDRVCDWNFACDDLIVLHLYGCYAMLLPWLQLFWSSDWRKEPLYQRIGRRFACKSSWPGCQFSQRHAFNTSPKSNHFCSFQVRVKTL